jgi:predicted DNA-binding transcriptional regulator YafY
VTLQIDNHVAKFFKQKPISVTQQIISEDDKHLTLKVQASSDWEIIPIIKSWIPFIKVLDPIRIQNQVENDARKFLAQSLNIFLAI